MAIDKNDFIYMKIYNDIYEKIKSNVLKPGGRIQPENSVDRKSVV